MATLTINGRPVTAPAAASVLDAALSAGIEIPRLCHHPELSAWGGCRLCLVEVEGQRAPVPACGLAAKEGMVVTTRSERLTALRREVLDFLLSDHPLHCVICDKAGRCDLQRYAYEFGLLDSSHEKEFSRTLYQDDNAFFIRDHQYCISCTRCVRVCDEIVGRPRSKCRSAASALTSPRRSTRRWSRPPAPSAATACRSAPPPPCCRWSGWARGGSGS